MLCIAGGSARIYGLGTGGAIHALLKCLLYTYVGVEEASIKPHLVSPAYLRGYFVDSERCDDIGNMTKPLTYYGCCMERWNQKAG